MLDIALWPQRNPETCATGYGHRMVHVLQGSEKFTGDIAGHGAPDKAQDIAANKNQRHAALQVVSSIDPKP